MPNLLKKEKSPYLKQHEHNPVDWYAWNKETLLKAKDEKKPIFLSVGYASCHWCHVMAHESFEDQETAKFMNEKFINIKVDREERPDLDYVFQKSLSILTGTQGGWPLSMFLDENGVPFTGGTYFPPKEIHGRPNFKSVLENVSDVYEKNREKIISQVDQMKSVFDELNRKTSVLNQPLEPFVERIIQYLDKENLYFPIDLSSSGSCMIGGNIATNAGGINALKYGSMKDNIIGVEVVTGDGKVLSSLSKMKKNNTGYDLKSIICNSEGTLGLISKALLKIYPKPIDNFTFFASYNDLESCIKSFNKIHTPQRNLHQQKFSQAKDS